MTTTQNQVTKRPELLTVLCILSFVGQGYLLLKNFIILFAVTLITRLEPIVERSLEGFHYHGPFRQAIYNFLEQAVSSMDHFLTLVLGNLLLIGITLYGVILMWNLNKKGFLFFVAGKFFLLLFPASLKEFQSFSLIEISVKGTIALIFIILFALNLKAMK